MYREGEISFAGITAPKLQEIRNRLDIVQIIGQTVSLRKRGNRYVGACPFHQEKTPSFSVSREQGLYYCFGCHAGGDIFSFVRQALGLDFRNAVLQLAAKAGVEILEENPAERLKRLTKERLYKINEQALKFFEKMLAHPEIGLQARNYLLRRGYPLTFIKEKRLGFGANFAALWQHFRQLPEFLKLSNLELTKDLSKAGLTSENGERGLFDQRLLFPIFNVYGLIVGFGGRSLVDNPEIPKYINTRDCLIFNKSELLYGLFSAQGFIRQSKRIILVEGYLDVLALHLAGINEGAAALGTAFTDKHAGQCASLAEEAVLLFDGDSAGERAAFKAAMALLKRNLKVYLVHLPDKHDPDSFLKAQGKAALQNEIATARPALEVFMEMFFKDAKEIEHKVKAAEKVMPLINVLNSGLEKELYLSKLSTYVGVSTTKLEESLAAYHQHTSTKKADKTWKKPEKSKSKSYELKLDNQELQIASSLELEMLSQLLLYPELRSRFIELAEFALTAEMRILLNTLADTQESVLNILEKNVVNPLWLERLSKVKPIDKAHLLEAGIDGDIQADKTFKDILLQLKCAHLDLALKKVIGDLAEAENQGVDVLSLLQKKRELTILKRKLRNLKPD